MKISKIIMGLTLSIGLVVSLIPATALAAEKTALDLNNTKPMGQLVRSGDRITYRLDDSSVLIPEKKLGAKVKAALPEKFDLRTEGKVQPIRDQGNFGNCWTFGALASMESSLIMKGNASTSINLSENHLTWFNANGKNTNKDKSEYGGGDTFNLRGENPYNNGGGGYFSVPTLARGYGAVDESVINYNGEWPSALQTVSNIRLANADYLPETVNRDEDYVYKSTNMESINTVKDCIKNKGIVDISYYDDDKFTNYENSTIYGYNAVDSNGNPLYANHEVSIVGWDDDFSKDKFGTGTQESKPTKNGAWIIRNSWGKDAGDKGYYYLSYYDKTTSEPTSFQGEDQKYNEQNTEHKYTSAYQYDGVGSGDTQLASMEAIVEGANLFTARQDELISAVGTCTFAADSNVCVKIYKGPKTTNPESGELVYENDFPVTYRGYHTLDLGKEIEVTKGENFSVIVAIKDGQGYALPFETEDRRSSYNICSIDVSNGQSYIKKGNIPWKDVSTLETINNYRIGNATIKAFSVAKKLPAQVISLSKTDFDKTDGNAPFKLNAKITTGNGTLQYSSSNNKVATVSTSGTVTIKGPGKAKIYIKSRATDEYSEAPMKTAILTVKPKAAVLSSAVSSKAGTLKATWKKDTKATGYQVRIGKNSSFTSGKQTYTATKNTTTSKTFTKLSKKKYYYVKARSYKISGGEKIYGNYSKIKKVKVK
ncbi:MAG: lectin like domain-containing protein [Anaerovoracaceae bacterium]